MRNKFDNKV